MKLVFLPLLLLALTLGAGIAGLEGWLHLPEWPSAVAVLFLPLVFGYVASRANPRRAFALGFALMFAAWLGVWLVMLLEAHRAPVWDDRRLLLTVRFALFAFWPGALLGFAAGGIGLALRRRNGFPA